MVYHCVMTQVIDIARAPFGQVPTVSGIDLLQGISMHDAYPNYRNHSEILDLWNRQVYTLEHIQPWPATGGSREELELWQIATTGPQRSTPLSTPLLPTATSPRASFPEGMVLQTVMTVEMLISYRLPTTRIYMPHERQTEPRAQEYMTLHLAEEMTLEGLFTTLKGSQISLC
jgi:hypothetical protein